MRGGSITKWSTRVPTNYVEYALLKHKRFCVSSKLDKENYVYLDQSIWTNHG